MSHYTNALCLLEQNRWRDAVKELKEGAEENEGMCFWLLSEAGLGRFWGIQHKKDWLKKGYMTGVPRCLLKYYRYNGSSPQEKLEISKRILDSDDDYTKGEYYRHIENSEKAAFYYRRSALSGDFFGMIEYAYYSQEDKYLIIPAEKGNVKAQLELAFRLSDKENYKDAIYWYRKAADQEHLYCQYILICLFLKLGSSPIELQNIAAGYYWVKRARNSIVESFVPSHAINLLESRKSDFQKIDACQSSCFALMAVRRYRQSILSVIPKDVVRLIAKQLWLTRDEDCWEVSENRKRIKF